MRLSQLGELGLLAELERRGLIVGVEHDAAQLAGGLVVTQDALVEGVHFRLDWIAWRELGFRAAAVEPQRPRGVGRRARGAGRHARGARGDRRWRRASSCTRASPRRACRSSAATRPRPAGRAQRHCARPRASACPAARARGRATLLVVTGPLGGAGAAFREPRRTSVRRSASTRAGGSREPRTRCSTSRTGSPSTRATSRAARAFAA